EMPLPPHPRRVARRRQRLRDGDLPPRHAIGAAGDRDRLRPRTDRMPARQKRRAARRALRLDIEVEKPRPLGGELVNPRCRRPTQHTTAVTANLTPPEVVPKEDDDIRLLLAHTDIPTEVAAPTSAKAAKASALLTRLRADLRSSARRPRSPSPRSSRTNYTCVLVKKVR